MAENQFFIDSDKLSEAALERKHKLETDPSSRTNHMEYMPGMEQIDPTIRNKVLSEMDSYDYNKYTEERRVGKECRSRWAPDHEKKGVTGI